MTVLAYRNGVLAADSMVSSTGGEPDIIFTKQYDKLIKTDKVLAGFAGSTKNVAKAAAWVRAGAIPADAPGSDASGIVVYKTDDGLVPMHYCDGSMYEIKDEFFAEGSGIMVALGAMYAGASARVACKAAIEFIPNCGGEVKSISFD